MSWSPERLRFLQQLVARERQRAINSNRKPNWSHVAKAFNNWYGTRYQPAYLLRRAQEAHVRGRAAAYRGLLAYGTKLESVIQSEKMTIKAFDSEGNVIGNWQIRNTSANLIQVLNTAISRLDLATRAERQELLRLQRRTRDKDQRPEDASSDESASNKEGDRCSEGRARDRDGQAEGTA